MKTIMVKMMKNFPSSIGIPRLCLVSLHISLTNPLSMEAANMIRQCEYAELWPEVAAFLKYDKGRITDETIVKDLG